MSRKADALMEAMFESGFDNDKPMSVEETGAVSAQPVLTAEQAKQLKELAEARNLPRKTVQELKYMTRAKALALLGLPENYFGEAQEKKEETAGERFARLHPKTQRVKAYGAK